MRKCIFSLVIVLALAANAGAMPLTYQAFLSGPNEFPVNPSLGVGYALVTIDPVANTLQIDASFSGLSSGTTVAHIHCCTVTPFAAATAGVAVTPGTLPGFPIGLTSGVYSTLLDTSAAATYTTGFVTASGGTLAGAEAALIAAFDTGRAYFNIHTSTSPGGEIRGFLTPVPEPATLGLLALGLVATWRVRRRASRSASGR